MIFMAFGISETVSGYMWISMLRPDQGGLLNTVIATVIPGFSHVWLGVAAIVTTSVPLLIFVVFQRYFATGAQVGSGTKE